MTTAFDAKKVKTGICRFKSKCHRPPVSTDSRRLDVSSAVRSRHATRTPLFSPSRFTHLFPSFLSRLSNAFLSFPFAFARDPRSFHLRAGKTDRVSCLALSSFFPLLFSFDAARIIEPRHIYEIIKPSERQTIIPIISLVNRASIEQLFGRAARTTRAPLSNFRLRLKQ